MTSEKTRETWDRIKWLMYHLVLHEKEFLNFELINILARLNIPVEN